MAHELGLAHFTLDLRDEFRRGVVDPWLDGYARGETPNPCVRCNGEVRIAPMVDLADRLGAERLVTGHYAQLSEVDDPSGPLLVAGVDESKDQAYALARVPGAVLSKLELPLGSLRKTQVRELAAEMGLAAASALDSQDLCFLAGMGREAFLQRHSGLGDDPGEVVGTDGIEISRHRGVHHHTVGQRKGLGIGGGVPLYVIGTDASTKKVTVGPREALSTTRVELTEVDLRRDAPRVTSARLRHRAPVAAARLTMTDSDSGVLELATPLDRVASGQMACLLDGEIVIGSATVRACGA
jgi:tRNA-specific 2-thiouridylase